MAKRSGAASCSRASANLLRSKATKADPWVIGLRRRRPPLVVAVALRDTQDRSEIDINKLIWTVMDLVYIDLRKHQIELKTELSDQLPPVLGNRIQLQQVILNLVMNAIDAMRSVPDRVLTVKTTLNELDGVHVSIADTGIGIEPSNLDQIFKPLFTTKEHGMGMGLSICRSIVESHNGRIWASAGQERGPIFQLALPTKAGRA
jgi:signal transduction histidine kinase